MSKSKTIKSGYGSGTLMTEKEIIQGRAADAARANKGMVKEMRKVSERKALPELNRLRAKSRPEEKPAPDPHKDLVKANTNLNEPSVVSAEPNLVQVQRAKQHYSGQT